MTRLDGKIAIVTGGGRGIGLAVAKAFSLEGASVAVADISGDSAQAAAEEIRASGGRASAHRADVSVRGDLESLVDRLADEVGIPSIAFCSAGITTAGGDTEFLALTDDEWERIMAVNVRGTFLTAQVVARHLVAAGAPGSLITMSSIGADRPMYGSPAYHTSKAAVAGLTRALAVNLAHHGIRANTIAPGYISTPMLQDLLTEERETILLSRVPAGRLGSTDDLTGAAVFLASDDSDYISGETLHIDGGAFVQGWTPGQPVPAVERAER